MGKFCENCGKELKANVKFCDGCGAETKGASKSKAASNENTATLLNMDPKVETILVYLIPLIGLIGALMKEKNYNEFSVFHYKQAATLFILSAIVSIGTSIFAFLILPAIAGGIVAIVLFVYTIVALIKAYQGEKYEIPVVCNITKSLWK